MKQKMVVDVKNAPESAFKYRYMVVTVVEGCAWFYGAWNNREYAEEAVKNDLTVSRLIIETADETETAR